MSPARPTAHDTMNTGGRAITVMRQAVHDRSGPRHQAVTHTYAALAYYRAGRARIEQNGTWRLGVGDVLLVPAGEPHRSLEAKRAEYWGLSFCVSCVAADGGASLLEPFERVRRGGAPVVHITESRQRFLDTLFTELEAASKKSEAGGDVDAVQRSLLTLILNELERAAVTAPAASSKRSVVVDSLQFIERNCLKRLTLKDVAKAVRRTPSYVTSALTQATGRSAVEWIVSGRMAEARRLLLHSDEMVDVIAERVGYADATHFIRMFRRAHGMTPAAWRTAQRT